MMKRILMTAAALTLGTSALAWAPADKPSPDAAALEASDWSAKPAAGSWSDEGMATADKLGMASPDKIAAWETAGKLMTKDEDLAKPEMAALESGWNKAKLESATMDLAEGKDGTLQTASVDVKPGMDKESGFGDPQETVATGYPPCDPGPGDDGCIQLYERGVHHALAQWKGGEGGEGDVAMGGPYEPPRTSRLRTSSRAAQARTLMPGTAPWPLPSRTKRRSKASPPRPRMRPPRVRPPRSRPASAAPTSPPPATRRVVRAGATIAASSSTSAA
jgi:hypothetical protein